MLKGSAECFILSFEVNRKMAKLPNGNVEQAEHWIQLLYAKLDKSLRAEQIQRRSLGCSALRVVCVAAGELLLLL